MVFVEVSSVNSRSPCAIPLISNSGKYSSATFNFSTRPGDSPWFLSISCDVKFIFGFLLKIDFVPTKNLPVIGSVPQNIAGAPSHFVVILNEFDPLPLKVFASKSINTKASFAPCLPSSKMLSSRCSKCVFLLIHLL